MGECGDGRRGGAGAAEDHADAALSDTGGDHVSRVPPASGAVQPSAFAAASVVLIITPGPDMALQISRTVNYGRVHGVATALGSNVGILVHSVLVAFGISLLIVAAPIAFLTLKIAGALYLIWLAVQAVLFELSEKFRADPLG